MSPTALNATALTAAGLIDSGQSSSPYSFSQVPLDNSTRYSPSKALRNGTGLLSLQSIGDGSVRVTVVVSWKSEAGANRSITTGTIVGGYRP
jgi:hypothetical protein